MTPAVEIYERVLADADQRDIEARLATLSAIAKDVEKRRALAPVTRRISHPLPMPLLVSHNDDDGAEVPPPFPARSEPPSQTAPARSLATA